MPRKAPDLAQLAKALRAPSFAGANADQAFLKPVSPTTMVLRVSEIKAYEHNPRLTENREYPRLKDSIRSRRGLTTPLTVTKRPGEDLYTIAAGGNSRLRVLQELADETGDEAFSFVTCRFEPWESECRVFANHLIENDVRGTMTFGDKARAIIEWRRLYEETHPDDAPLSQRQLVERLAEAGYCVPRTLITPWVHTAELLLPHLPIAFGSGLGRPAAERLLRLRSCCEQYWSEQAATKAPSTKSAFDELFAEVCSRQDCHCAHWDHELFQHALMIQLAKALALDHKVVALDVDSLYHGCSLETPETFRSPPSNDPGLKSEWAFERSREFEASKRERSKARRESKARAHSRPDRVATEPAPTLAGNAGASPASTDGRFDLAQLRENNYALAEALAGRHELGHLLRPAATGFGFYIEPPEPSAVQQTSHDRDACPHHGLVLSGIRSGLWWLLCFMSDQLDLAHVAALGTYYPASWLVELLIGLPKRSPQTDPIAALNLLVGEPTAQGLVGDMLMDPGVTDQDCDALDRLLRGCRKLRVITANGVLALWPTAL